MVTVLITGGTGMIGKALSKALLNKGYSVIILTRNPVKKSEHDANVSIESNRLSYAKWDVEKQDIEKSAISKADYIVHLAGASVAEKRWTQNRKNEIVNSRINSSKLIVDSLNGISNNVKAVISASAIGWYGHDSLSFGEGRGEVFAETDPPSNDFLGQTCKQWEENIEPVISLGKRLVKLRIGIVLSKEGGALPEFTKPLRFGIATILGSGSQIMSWIHIDDLVSMFIYALENEKMTGTYNAVASSPVSNKDLVLTLAKSMKGKFFIPVHVPSFVLKLLLGEMSVEVLKSATVSSEKIIHAGYQFQYPDIKSSMKQLAGKISS